jgi:hypothetical protein
MFTSVTPSTALRKKKLPPLGTHKSLPGAVPSSFSRRSTSAHSPVSARLSLVTLALRSPMRKTSSIVPTNSSIASGWWELRHVNALPQSAQNPRRPRGDEENSLKGLAATEGLEEDGGSHFSCEGRTVMKCTTRLPECLRHWVHWHV